MKRYVDHKLIIYNSKRIPKRKVLELQSAIKESLEAVGERLQIWLNTKIEIWIETSLENGVWSRGATHKKQIEIQITKKYMMARGLPQRIGSTMVHEYVHLIRLRSGLNKHGSNTVLSAAVEEGISMYIQGKIFGYPDYVDMKQLSKKKMQMFWNRVARVLDKPSKKYPVLEEDNVWRSIFYQLSFGIVWSYMKYNREVTLAKLVKTPSRTLMAHARKMYGNAHTKKRPE